MLRRCSQLTKTPLYVPALARSLSLGEAIQDFGRAARRAARQAARQDEPQPVAIEGTAPFYHRQLVVVDAVSTPTQWPKKLEMSNHLIAAYTKAKIAINENPKTSPLNTIAATPFPLPSCADATAEATEMPAKHDVLVFPELVRVHDVTLEQIPALVEKLVPSDVDVQGVLHQENLEFSKMAEGYHIFVCAHEQRDFRCGCNGPLLLRWLKDIGEKRNISLHLYSASHFGGHRYAANAIVYPSGDWFGLLNEPADAEALVQALEDQDPLRLASQWRGRINMTKEEQIEALQTASEA
ncbi:hypothetical protein Poli38472_011867 [Pythium oligandrum]|uniref:Uncharacterized protein n=1 Tax=Pythium oligandrum TaxID=41045 RepID=A0A8K1C892_PYTOL|nr:hypothetical protein Poli38472_011867 [Pythium oligandrum]|eukprot:TMW58279.1 hypothetical protein Poli38472_011867 [Pythium oligandrum]